MSQRDRLKRSGNAWLILISPGERLILPECSDGGERVRRLLQAMVVGGMMIGGDGDGGNGDQQCER
ncbi:MAG: hypothetical protein HKN81_07400 [Gammaproteobacteria bacterium]|nr:hypothetical protein [Gammaproteobacteria bacterium]